MSDELAEHQDQRSASCSLLRRLFFQEPPWAEQATNAERFAAEERGAVKPFHLPLYYVARENHHAFPGGSNARFVYWRCSWKHWERLFWALAKVPDVWHISACKQLLQWRRFGEEFQAVVRICPFVHDHHDPEVYPTWFGRRYPPTSQPPSQA